uniref:Major facilitator superfamily (MFS) profile domain-containing protein n=1 Tax=Electrophorus electricus TaxID=8005 RepID=A0A4W4FVQ9_ELEEL
MAGNASETKPSEDKHPCSSQKYGSVSHETAEGDIPSADAGIKSSKRAYVAVAVLCYVNLLNYMDRYTIAGVLPSIQNYFRITDSTSGLLQTVFICSFMLLAPAFGYLGDRYNRKVIMVAGMIAWIVTTLGSSFITEEYFWVLVLMRALVGTGEASYCTIAPTIIGDLFIGSQRSIMISFFYIFIPVGSGLGYILGSKIASVTGDWHWALRLNPILGVPGLLLLVFLMPNPPRGASEMQGSVCIEHTSYLEDVKYLLRNLIFGVITVVTGIMGVFVGTAISRKLRDRLPSADPIICAVGMLSSSPCLFLAIVLAGTSIPVTYTFIGIGEVLLSLNWAIIADILLYVVIPTRRATAEALQIMVCHLLGDAGSPYLLGIISDVVSKLQATSLEWRFHSLEYSILICPFIGVLGGLFFLFTALYIKEDRRAAEVLAIGTAGRAGRRSESLGQFDAGGLDSVQLSLVEMSQAE